MGQCSHGQQPLRQKVLKYASLTPFVIRTVQYQPRPLFLFAVRIWIACLPTWLAAGPPAGSSDCSFYQWNPAHWATELPYSRSSCRPAGLMPKEDFGKLDASRKIREHISNLRAWAAIVWSVRDSALTVGSAGPEIRD
jgi:hypothetical protein